MKSQMTDFAFGAKCSWASRMLPKASMPRPLPALQRKSRLVVRLADARSPLIDIGKLVQGEEDVTEVDEGQPQGRGELILGRLATERHLERPLGGLGPRGKGF